MSVDKLLFELIRKGDVNAFEHFYRNSYMRLFNYVSLFVKDEDDVKDIVQDSFINIWNNRCELRLEKSIESFVFKSIRNRCINYLRDKEIHNRHLNCIAKEIKDVQFLSENDFNGFEEEPIEYLIQRELKEACEQLSPKCREVFEMCKFEGRLQKEVAEELNISVKAIERHISNAKKHIRIHIESKYPGQSLIPAILIGCINLPML
ncbi:RNA polymerase sigma-70 factor [Carboxylicivirga sediminis]|uniref:RNA polymerase sigma-70 factor n=1 Tax=Carboxylicivirga sediminis TaxID=2006564 RepID=A0A941F3U9_9BACT|nr:RNA polymerase sigma-70 factor [Carboxylicivirga sediminis]MBR8535899.1 RNA polymerase sigma-70 factor [Carboxylicivirga sediminis]